MPRRIDAGASRCRAFRLYFPHPPPVPSPAMVDPLLQLTRRHFFRDCAVGLGGLALTSLLQRESLAANPLAPKPAPFGAKAKAVIYLFMAGGPSQLELYDPKPRLQQLNGQPIPDEYLKGKRFA